MTIRVRVVLLALVASIALAAAPAAADQTYILTAAKWGKAQTDAVVAAGGIVTFSHEAAGVAIATSSDPDFLARVLSSKKMRSGAQDEVVQLPVGPTVDFDATSITPGNEPFFGPYQWAPGAVSAPAAWAVGCTGYGVRVAILDGGLYNLHPDLAPNVDRARSTSFVPGFPYNQDTGTFWHGTHVAGIVAAADNNLGVIGIAPEATLIGVKVLHDGSGSYGQVLQGILYAATPIAAGGAGADIINMSLGGYWLKAGGHNTLFAAVNQAVTYAASRGVLVVSAAGNDSVDLDHAGPYVFMPGENANGLMVSATGPVGFAYGATNFRRSASYTNYGNSAITVAAPGGDFAYPGNEACTAAGFTTACWVFDMVLSTSRVSWTWAAGTSMAAPVVSAIAALAIQSHPGISLGALKTLIQRSADDEGEKGHDPFYGHGFVNAYKACTAK